MYLSSRACLFEFRIACAFGMLFSIGCLLVKLHILVKLLLYLDVYNFLIWLNDGLSFLKCSFSSLLLRKKGKIHKCIVASYIGDFAFVCPILMIISKKKYSAVSPFKMILTYTLCFCLPWEIQLCKFYALSRDSEARFVSQTSMSTFTVQF